MNHLLPNIQKAWDSAKPFQIEDANFVIRNGRVVLGHKTGLGKTFIALMAWGKWSDVNRVYVVGTLSSVSVWRRLIKEWGGGISVFLQGENDPNWERSLKESGIYLMTYATYRLLMRKTRGRISCDLLICDELHRVLRSRKSQVYKTALLRTDFKYFIGLSATWASRGPQDIWPVLHLANKRLFPSFWRFAETFCWVDRTPFGLEIYGTRNPEALRRLLWERYYVARTFKQVANQFIKGDVHEEPVIRRQTVLPLSAQQQELRRSLVDDMVATLGDRTVITPTSLARLTRLLQLAICPKILFPEAEYGPAIDWLCDKVSEDPHTIIFSPFEEALKICAKAIIEDGYPEDKIFYLHGGLHPDKLDATIDAWKESKGLIFCTISYAQSFATDTTDTAYFLGYSWDPNDNIQAEGRLRRMDSILTTPCLVRYIVMEGSEYEDVRDVIDGKVINVQQFLIGYGKEHQIPKKDLLISP